MNLLNTIVFLVSLAFVYEAIQADNNVEQAASTWLDWYNSTAEQQYYTDTVAAWNYYTNATDYNANVSAQADTVLSTWSQQAAQNASTFNMTMISDNRTQRLLSTIATVGIKLNASDTLQLSTYINQMIGLYSTATICGWSNGAQNCSIQWLLDPDLMHVMETSRDYDELSYVWNEWRRITSVNKATYMKFVPLSNRGARNDGFDDTGAWWRSWYEQPDAQFKTDLENLYYQILPLYEKLHAYILTRLKTSPPYTDRIKGQTIPAHLLGNMWGQEWQNLPNAFMPYPREQPIDVTAEMVKQNYTPSRMFHLADDFFGSLGLIKMPPPFWTGSIITKPNWPFICHASAWDFYNRHDFRIKMCTKVDMNDLITIHHEMGHIEYYLNYASQPVSFRSGANPGFHEAIGDTMALSVSTPAHLQAIGLLNKYTPNNKVDINYLFKQALEKIAFLPFGYMIDHWRWNVFDGNLTPDQWNQGWWDLRYKYQGLSPPTPRPASAFDPAAKSHIDDNTPYIRYFVSFIVQFQFYQSLCNAANHTGPLHQCDFFNNPAAGQKLSHMLQMGSSQPWPQAMQVLTGQSKMDASAIRSYFSTLELWLDDQKLVYDVPCYGWGYQWPATVTETLPTPRCPDQATPVKSFLQKYNSAASTAYYNNAIANWNYNTNITNATAQAASASDAVVAQFQLTWAPNATQLYSNGLNNLDSNSLRQLKKIKTININLNSSQTLDLSNTINSMAGTYSSATICELNTTTNMQDCSKHWDLPNNLTSILATSTNYKLLSYVWEQWRNAAGRPIKSQYQHLVNLMNTGATSGGHKDAGDAWRSVYEDANFQQDIQNLWNQILPLYEQLHTYVRKQLRMTYPGQWNSNAIPAHVLGNMWAQSWVNVFDHTAPFKNVPSIDVTQNMVLQGYTAVKMFQTADNFFGSLGMIRMPQKFWNNSMIVQPADGRKVVCHASAWDFYNAKDVRIKMCTHVNMNDLVTIHHEMGHIEYYLQYAKQPVVFRSGANPGFHEAIGDTMALSVNTPAHMTKIGLLNYTSNYQQDLNYLYRQALSKIAFLPFGYIMDQWRWNVFSGNSTYPNWNSDWWKLRFQYQGVEPPVPRGTNDFDPGAKFHIPSNVPYIRYFISYVVQFQFYKAMCTAAGYNGSLHSCDFYNSTQAGTQLAQMMQLGSSVPWPQALNAATGSPTMSASALMEYFKPLMDWLKIQNQGECFGWGASWPGASNLPQPRCGTVQATPTQSAQQWLNQYNVNAGTAYHHQIVTAWAYETNITDYNQKQSDQAATARVVFDQQQVPIAKKFDLNQITDYSAKRQLNMISTIGLNLTKNGTSQFNNLVSNMFSIFSQAYICNPSYPDCASAPMNDSLRRWYRDPTLIEMLANSSTSYDMLQYIFTSWRNVTGRIMLPMYQRYVQLGNKGARQSGFTDMGDYWRSAYEDQTFRADLENLWRQILPLYEQLHTYVRRKLQQKYPGKFGTSAIPAHILGNMWAQEWNNLYSFTTPYMGVPSVDVTSNMQSQSYTAKRMFTTAESFYKSIGMYAMNPTFWNISMITRPQGRDVDCYASAEDFYNGVDFGIKMCTKITMEDLITIHHEMGHVEYFMAYSKQPIKFRNGANPGFHEAIGDTMALSVSTPSHLNKIGLLPNTQYQPNNTQQDINFLYKTALSKIAFLPFGYLIDNYRWQVFDGTIHADQMNSGWWDLRYKYQGMVPPAPRSNSDFDAGSKFHVADNVPYIRYFVSFIIQFQFHKALCQAAGQGNVPLHQCDIYNSTAAGTLLKNTLTLGASQPWPEAMMKMANTTKMDAQPLLDYFAPLITWLNTQNQQNFDCFGWGYTWPSSYNLPTPRCSINLKGGGSNTTTQTASSTSSTSSSPKSPTSPKSSPTSPPSPTSPKSPKSPPTSPASPTSPVSPTSPNNPTTTTTSGALDRISNAGLLNIILSLIVISFLRLWHKL